MTFAVGDNLFLHRQANFAVISLLSRSGVAAPSIVIATDRPEYYHWLEKYVTVLGVDAKTLDEWRGPHRNFWRIKLRLMERVYRESPGHLVYLDSDVVCRAPLASFFASLDSGMAFMHKIEYFMRSKGGQARALMKQAAGRSFGGLAVDSSRRMWNAGLVALPAKLAPARINDALECLDALCAAEVESALLEQLSLSLSLDRDLQLRPAEDWFIHYWGNKTAWNALIARFFADMRVRDMSVSEVCESFRELRLDLPPTIKRKRLERFANGVRRRVFRRDHSVDAQVTAELLGARLVDVNAPAKLASRDIRRTGRLD